MATQTSFQIAPATPLPPFLALPLELKLQIFSYFRDTPDCSLRILRRVHSSLRHVIPRGRSTFPYSISVRTAELRTAEEKHPYLFPPDHSPCYRCYDVLPGSSFDDSYSDLRFAIDIMLFGREIFRDERTCNGCYSP